MPRLELGNLRTPAGRAVTIFHIAAVMAWPNPQDPAQRGERERCFAEIAALMQERSGRRTPLEGLPEFTGCPLWEHTDRKEYIAARALSWLLAGWGERRNNSIGQAFSRSGGDARVVEARRWSEQVADCDNHEVGWRVAAEMMRALYKLASAAAIPGVSELVSVNKAAYLVAKRSPIHQNEHHIEELWRQYRPVAHLCAALETWGGPSWEEIDRNFDEHLFNDTREFLAGAKQYENWLVGRFKGANKKEKGANKKGLRVRRDDLWWIPIRDLRGTKLLPAPALEGDEIDWLKEYKAYEGRRVGNETDLDAKKSNPVADQPDV